MGSEASRPPRLEDLLLLCRSLNESGARYVVAGGFAMILHGYTRGTMDVDILVDPSAENLRRIKIALSKLPDNAAADLADTDVQKYQVVRVADEIVVDLLGKACGVGFEEAWPHALHKQIEGVDIPYLDEATLVRTKNTGRPKDQQDLMFLKHKRG